MSKQNKEARQKESRREFLASCGNLLAGVVVVGVAAPLMGGCEESTVLGNDDGGTGSTETFDVSTLTQDGEGLQAGGTDSIPDVIIIRLSEGNYRTLSAICTHQACLVGTPENGLLACPCHGSRFELDGSVRVGPAAAPLKEYATVYNEADGTVSVTFG